MAVHRLGVGPSTSSMWASFLRTSIFKEGGDMIKSILVGVDASTQAAAAREHAVELARAYQARVVGVHVLDVRLLEMPPYLESVSYTHLRAHETVLDLVCRLLLEKKK